MELSAFRISGRAVQHGGLQGARDVRLLEERSDEFAGGRRQVGRRDGPIWPHHPPRRSAERQGHHRTGERSRPAERRKGQGTEKENQEAATKSPGLLPDRSEKERQS